MDTPFAQSSGNSDISSQKRVNVQIYATGADFTGYMCCPCSMRLLDVLNGGMGSLFSDVKFICVGKPEAGSDGAVAGNHSIQINKDKILFLREVGDYISRGLNEVNKSSHYPFVQKVSSRFKVKLPAYTLVGDVYHLEGQDINEILNSRHRFLPMTDVEVFSGQEVILTGSMFIAVNKDQIIYLEEAVEN